MIIKSSSWLIMTMLWSLVVTKNSTTDDELHPTLRIIGGHDEEAVKYPWMVSILQDYRPFCGGALISSNAIVTAAHCFMEPNPDPARITLLLGRDTPYRDFIPASQIFVHELFQKEVFHYDTALIMLPRPAKVTQFAKLAFKPDTGVAKVIGWGSKRREGVAPNQMQGLEVNILPDAQCLQNIHFDSNLSFCAMGSYTDQTPCLGDSGGPIFMGTDYLIGTVSFGRNCEGNSVYAKISTVTDWLRQRSQQFIPIYDLTSLSPSPPPQPYSPPPSSPPPLTPNYSPSPQFYYPPPPPPTYPRQPYPPPYQGYRGNGPPLYYPY